MDVHQFPDVTPESGGNGARQLVVKGSDGLLTTSDRGAPCRSAGLELMKSTTHEIRASAAAEAVLPGIASAR